MAQDSTQGNSAENHEIHLDHILDLGHSTMKTERVWTGLGLSAFLVMGFYVATFGGRFAQSGRIEGKVVYHGRPIKTGVIVFASLDRERSEDVVAEINASGRFACPPDWRRDSTGPSRFQIQVCPDPRKRQMVPPSVAPGPGPQDGECRVGERGMGGEPGPGIVRASMDSPALVSRVGVVETGRQPLVSDARAPVLEVSLSSSSPLLCRVRSTTLAVGQYRPAEGGDSWPRSIA
jgi:hypothetical protein